MTSVMNPPGLFHKILNRHPWRNLQLLEALVNLIPHPLRLLDRIEHLKVKRLTPAEASALPIIKPDEFQKTETCSNGRAGRLCVLFSLRIPLITALRPLGRASRAPVWGRILSRPRLAPQSFARVSGRIARHPYACVRAPGRRCRP